MQGSTINPFRMDSGNDELEVVEVAIAVILQVRARASPTLKIIIHRNHKPISRHTSRPCTKMLSKRTRMNALQLYSQELT